MKATTYIILIALLICVVAAIDSASNYAEIQEQSTQLAQKIKEMEAQINAAPSKHIAQTTILAQSEGLLDELKMLFLNLALKIVEAVS